MSDLPNANPGCIFCGGTPLTREHVLGRWIGNALKNDPSRILPDKMEVNTAGSSGHRASWTANHPAILIAKCVCRPCNNHWMKDIGDAAQPLVESMVTGSRTLLNAQAREAVATWAAGVAILGRYTHSPVEPVRDEWLKYFYAYRRPLPNWYVWLTQYRGQMPVFYEGHDIEASLPLHPTKGTPATTHGILATFVIGYLAVQVLGLESGTAGGNESFIRIWPERRGNFPLVWDSPPKFYLDDASLDVLKRRYLPAE